ncbi:site-specific integrase [Cohnella thailandensis]|uniref:Site-specific integrase n=1 Tax=Cohnella thailandensis TaxID=557557 RepID=A0A841SRJ6_9BACL|nr:site-specific integrase [Cohnella thailandensis]MBB6632798.1 site-specific integrase [Cohnella thailandensis]MBP1975510.1 integrase [Cohnella thailandensis]
MASFRKRGCKCKNKKKCSCGATWEFRISVTDPTTGERIQPSEGGFATKPEAEAAAAKLKMQYETGLLSAEAKDETIQSFMGKYLENTLIHEIEAATYEQKLAIMDRHIVPELGKLKLKKLTPLQVQSFINYLIGEDLNAGTIGNIMRLLNQTLNKAVEWGYVARNVVPMASKPRYKPEKFTVWTKQQFEHFLKNTKKSRLYPFYLIALMTGMRPGEITALTWEHINFKKKTIRVEQTVAWTKQKGIHIKNSPKNDASRRTITIPDYVVNYLREYKVAQQPNGLNTVIQGVKHDLMYNSVINQIMKTDITNTGLPLITPHDLRHTHATYLLSPPPFGLGQAIKAVSERLGHAKTSTTLNTYTHVLPNMQEALSDQLGASINF